jgi:hypothetical protein
MVDVVLVSGFFFRNFLEKRFADVVGVISEERHYYRKMFVR